MHYLIVVLIVGLGIITFPVMAQSPTDTDQAIAEEVDKLKEKIAEKVEELDTNNKAVAGIIDDIVGDTFFIINNAGDKIEASVDDTLTSYFEVSGSRFREKNKDDFEVGDYVFITGPEIGDTITANAVYKETSYLVFSGKITEVNDEDFTVRVAAVDKSTYVLDVETKTNMQLMDIDSLETSKIGFSKLKEGDAVHAVVKIDPANPEKTRFSAEKLLVIPNEYFIQ